MVKLKKIYNDSYKNQIIDRQVKKKLMNLNFKQVLSTYLKQNNRISISLSILLHLLIECRNPVTEFSKVIKRSSQPLKLFRALILLHECYLNSILQSQQALQILCEIKMVMNTKINSKLDQIISKQVLGPYILYLQKCFHVQTEEVYESQMNPEQILYQYLNLIKLGLSMVDILYTFGRYFKQVYSFIIDFNVLVGKDFAQIYESKIKSTLKKNKKLWDEQMKLELQKVHEKMYVVYYNCYYYKYLKFYIPKWIDTDYNRQRNHSVPVKRQRSQFKSPLKQNKSNLLTNLKVKPTQMSISTIFTQTKVSPGQFSNKMANSTIIPKDRKTKNLSLSFCPYVISQFTCEVSQNNNDEYVIDQIQSQNQNQKQNIQKNDKTQDPYILLASMERVIQLIDQNIEQASKCNNNKK